MLMSGHKITSLLKREMVDEHKAKVFDELTNLKKKYEVDQKSWTKDNKDPWKVEGQKWEKDENLEDEVPQLWENTNEGK